MNLDKLHRKSLSKVNELRVERNKVSDQIAEIKKTGGNADNEIRSMGKRLVRTLKKLKMISQIQKKNLIIILPRIPNPPHKSVPIGKDEKENKVVSSWVKILKLTLPLSLILKLATSGSFDFEQASIISGSGFPLYKGKGPS